MCLTSGKPRSWKIEEMPALGKKERNEGLGLPKVRFKRFRD